jgi:hypothetical protein
MLLSPPPKYESCTMAGAQHIYTTSLAGILRQRTSGCADPAFPPLLKIPSILVLSALALAPPTPRHARTARDGAQESVRGPRRAHVRGYARCRAHRRLTRSSARLLPRSGSSSPAYPHSHLIASAPGRPVPRISDPGLCCSCPPRRPGGGCCPNAPNDEPVGVALSAPIPFENASTNVPSPNAPSPNAPPPSAPRRPCLRWWAVCPGHSRRTRPAGRNTTESVDVRRSRPTRFRRKHFRRTRPRPLAARPAALR